MWPPEHSLITGASSGIGAAMAQMLACEGGHLTLLGRSPERLEEVASLCRAEGGCVETALADVCDQDAMTELIEAADQRCGLDLVIANAGVSGGLDVGRDGILATNIRGVLNTIEPAARLMKYRGRGRLALMASLAGFKSMPNAPVYCASKAAVRSYGEALAAQLKPHGLSVTVLCPGFIKTPLTDANPFAMPLIMQPPEAAKRLLKGIEKRHVRVAFPKRLYALTRMLELLPSNLAARLLTSLMKNQGLKE